MMTVIPAQVALHVRRLRHVAVHATSARRAQLVLARVRRVGLPSCTGFVMPRLEPVHGPGGGASKLTGDVTQIIAQLPPVLESLTGVKFEKLLEQVPALKKAMGQADEFVRG